jgi:iduronate 2-sulfatase
MHAYYACISYIDAQIGRLLAALEEEGLDKNTIIVLWSDHGWKLGEFNGWGKMSNYEIDTRVPLIFAAPSIVEVGRQIDHPVELLDIFPTLCDLAGIDKPDFLDGLSLQSSLGSPSHAREAPAFSQYYREFENQEFMGYAMRTQRYRFVEWREFATGKVTAYELYDHVDNHREDRNMIDEATPELIGQLTDQLLTSHPRRGLTMTPAVHSNPSPGRWASDIAFVNQTDTQLLVYPITPQGRRGAVKKIAPATQLTIQARLGGVYVVESADGTIQEIHSPSYPSRPIVIKPKQ